MRCLPAASFEKPIDKMYLETARSFMDRLREWESAMGEADVPAMRHWRCS